MPKIYTAVKAIIKRNNKYFIIKQKIGDKEFFDIPGGRMDHGETPQESMHREVKEEIGLDIKIEKIQGVWWFFREHDNDQVVCITFLCTVVGGEVDLSKNPDEEEIISFNGWLSKSEILKELQTSNTPNESFKDLIISLD